MLWPSKLQSVAFFVSRSPWHLFPCSEKYRGRLHGHCASPRLSCGTSSSKKVLDRDLCLRTRSNSDLLAAMCLRPSQSRVVFCRNHAGSHMGPVPVPKLAHGCRHKMTTPVSNCITSLYASHRKATRNEWSLTGDLPVRHGLCQDTQGRDLAKSPRPDASQCW